MSDPNAAARSQIALGGFCRLADSFRHFRLTVAETNATLWSANHPPSCENPKRRRLARPWHAVDVYELVDPEFAIALRRLCRDYRGDLLGPLFLVLFTYSFRTLKSAAVYLEAQDRLRGLPSREP